MSSVCVGWATDLSLPALSPSEINDGGQRNTCPPYANYSNGLLIYKDRGLRPAVVFLKRLVVIGSASLTNTFESRVLRKFPARFGVGGRPNL